MSWFKRHLNWTLLLGVLLIEIPATLAILAVWGNFPQVISVLITAVLLEWALVIWYLRQKRRSYAYLLLSLLKIYYVPVGFIILLCLKNKRVKPSEEVAQDNLRESSWLQPRR